MADGTSVSRSARHVIMRYRRLIAHSVYAILALTSISLAYLTRFDFRIPPEHLATLVLAAPVVVVVRSLVSFVLRLAVARWRYIGTEDLLRLGFSTVVGSMVLFAVTMAGPFTPAIPRSVLLLEAVLWTFTVACSWITYRLIFERLERGAAPGSAEIRSLIAGAGTAGSLLAHEIAHDSSGRKVIGFVDDDRLLGGTRIRGVPVLGASQDLPDIVRRHEVDEVIIAVPSAHPGTVRKFVEACHSCQVRLRILPGDAHLLSGDGSTNQLREVRIEDLLGRDPVVFALPELASALHGKSVLVTGAAGSIGSELARQIAIHQPAQLLLYDRAESDLYLLELELRERFPDLNIAPIIGDILDTTRFEDILTHYHVNIVYHAAAYKHVPMMESNVREAVRNNVLGTWRVADLSGRHRVERFVLISTDKAVRPSSIMGATKWVAEQVVFSCGTLYPSTAFSAVRFGNVIGSSGSVIPIFKRQLAAGAPLTLTHEDATRFFMTIPEAVQLVLQASVLSEARGRIAMLEMGEPVRMLDLAKNLIRLSGRTLGVDADIAVVGLRPGEKLHEELRAPDESEIETDVDKIRLLGQSGGSRGSGTVIERSGLLESVLETEGEDDRLRSLLVELLGAEDRGGLAERRGERSVGA